MEINNDIFEIEAQNENTEVEEENEEENEEERILTLVDDDGKKTKFMEIAVIYLEDDCYSIMQPIELLEGMSEDEAFVFKVETHDDGSATFDIVLDSDIIGRVFNEYNRLMDEQDTEE